MKNISKSHGQKMESGLKPAWMQEMSAKEESLTNLVDASK
jgi:hypothetical protein